MKYDDDVVKGVGNPTNRVRDLGLAMGKNKVRGQPILLNLQLYLRAKIGLEVVGRLDELREEMDCPVRRTQTARQQHMARLTMALAKSSLETNDERVREKVLPFDFGWREEPYTDPKTGFQYQWKHATSGLRE